MLRAVASVALRYSVGLILLAVIIAGIGILACLAIPTDAVRAIRRHLASKAT